MSAEPISEQEFEQAVESFGPPPQNPPEILPPCKIFTTDGVFVCPEIDMWMWHKFGIFAIGYWLDDDEESVRRDIVHFAGDVKRVEYDFSFQTQQVEEARDE